MPTFSVQNGSGVPLPGAAAYARSSADFSMQAFTGHSVIQTIPLPDDVPLEVTIGEPDTNQKSSGVVAASDMRGFPAPSSAYLRKRRLFLVSFELAGSETEGT